MFVWEIFTLANLIFNSRKFRRRVFPEKLLPNSTFHFIYITPPESFTSPTSSTSTSSTLHTSRTSPTSISTNLTYITQITHIIYTNFNQLHLHDIHYLSLSTSSAQSTGAQHLHISRKNLQCLLHRSHYTEVLTQELLHRSSYTVVAQDLLHRSCYTGVATQELLHRSCYTEVVTQELTSRWSTCIGTPCKTPTSQLLLNFSLWAAGAARRWLTKRQPLRRSRVSDAQTCGEMRIRLVRGNLRKDRACWTHKRAVKCCFVVRGDAVSYEMKV